MIINYTYYFSYLEASYLTGHTQKYLTTSTNIYLNLIFQGNILGYSL